MEFTVLHPSLQFSLTFKKCRHYSSKVNVRGIRTIQRQLYLLTCQHRLYSGCLTQHLPCTLLVEVWSGLVSHAFHGYHLFGHTLTNCCHQEHQQLVYKAMMFILIELS